MVVVEGKFINRSRHVTFIRNQSESLIHTYEREREGDEIYRVEMRHERQGH